MKHKSAIMATNNTIRHSELPRLWSKAFGANAMIIVFRYNYLNRVQFSLIIGSTLAYSGALQHSEHCKGPSNTGPEPTAL